MAHVLAPGPFYLSEAMQLVKSIALNSNDSSTISHVIGIFIFFCFRMLLNQHVLIHVYVFHMKPQHMILSGAKCFVH